MPPRGSLCQANPRLRVGVISLGCPKNLVDTEVMLGLLRQAGFSVVTEAEQAEVLLVNTCCFIGRAREESAEALAEAASLRRAGRAQALICAGCWPEMEAAQVRARFPEVDALIGPGDVPGIVSVVEQALAGRGSDRPLSPPSAYLYDHTAPRLRATPPWSAYLKIAEGCDHHCRFCVIPRLRGRYRSRSLESVLVEARQMAASGVREINLIAQDTTAYGRDLGGPDIGDLLSRLAEIEGLRWIRLLYAFPTRVTPRLVEVMASHRAICQYIDLPFQHADRALLRRMGRLGDGESYLKLIARLRGCLPDIAIRSTFLVGYPGEDDQAFGRLMEFLQAAQLDRAGAFCFSAEPGTRAAEMPAQVPAEVAEARYHQLMASQQGISLRRNQGWVGRQIEALIESRGSSAREWVGRSFRDAPEIDGSVIISSGRPLEPGRFVTVLVTAAQPYDLVARHPP